jgi:hypothetical protein
MCAIYLKSYLIDFPDINNFLKGGVKRDNQIHRNSKTIEESYVRYSKKSSLILLSFYYY